MTTPTIHDTSTRAEGDRTRRELVVFFLVAFIASWTVGGLGFLVLDLGLVGLMIGTATLLVTALVLTWRTTGSISPIVDQVLRWRTGPQWYAAALGVPFLVVGVAVLLAPLFGGEGLAPDPLGIGIVLLMLPMHVAIGGLEEPGWRGYALPRLQRRTNALRATLVLAALWMLWHVPLFLVSNPLFEQIPFTAYVVVGVASSVVYTWIYNSSGGSVLLVMLLHAAKNGTLVWLADDVMTWGIFAAAWVAAAAVIIIAYGQQQLARQPRHEAW